MPAADCTSSGKMARNSRPMLSFVEIISEVLEESETGMLSLQEIYDAVRKKYPFFRTKDAAWQNSIRHNLSMQGCFYKVDRPSSRPGKGSLWVSTRSGRPSNIKNIGNKGLEESLVVVAERMPPAVKNYCQWSPETPQIHSWSGDVWLKSAEENDLPSLLDDEDSCSTSCGSLLREEDTPSEPCDSQNEWPDVPRMLDLKDFMSKEKDEEWIYESDWAQSLSRSQASLLPI